jgi:hypothetical protein
MILYVMSRPHSGSTILDILLGNTPSIESVGQLVSDMGKLDNPCACGSTIATCPFWSEVRRRVAADGIGWDEAVTASVGQAHVRRFGATLRAPADDASMQRLAMITASITRAIAAVSGKPLVLDSSKEPARALFLARYVSEARLIRLVRDPRSAVASHYWRLKDKGYFHFLRRDYRAPALAPLFLVLAAASWVVGNLLHEIAASRARGRVTRILYEDLRDSPHRELRRLGAELRVDVEPVLAMIDSGQTLPAGHDIGGNDIRLEEGLRFDPAKETSRRALPRWVELMTVALCWPLMLRYGYPLKHQVQRPATGSARVASPVPCALEQRRS